MQLTDFQKIFLGCMLSLLLLINSQYGPQPTPPEPTPDPVVAGKIVVLIVEETADKFRLPPGQADIWNSQEVRDYLDSHCDGGKDGWRVFDKDQDVSNESQMWRDAMAQNRGGDFWIEISNGKTGTEGYWPANKSEALAILKKWGGE